VLAIANSGYEIMMLLIMSKAAAMIKLSLLAGRFMRVPDCSGQLNPNDGLNVWSDSFVVRMLCWLANLGAAALHHLCFLWACLLHGREPISCSADSSWLIGVGRSAACGHASKQLPAHGHPRRAGA
jgi:hypothetical protein